MDIILDYANVPRPEVVTIYNPQWRVFEEKSIHVFRYFPHVVHQLQWFGLDAMEERASALQYLGYMLLSILKQMHEAYDLRGLQLCDEHCDIYEAWIRKIDSLMRNIENFADDAEDILSKAYSAPHRQEQLEKLTEMYELLNTIVGCHIRVSENKCIELNMRYSPENLLRVRKGARRFFYLVLHFIALLTVPSHKDDSEQAFTELFRKSFKQYGDSARGQSVQETFIYKLTDEIADLDEKGQLGIMRSYKKKLGAEISEYLKSYGVEYCGISKDYLTGKLCKQLYECLNKVSASDETKGKAPENELEEKTKKMTNKELQVYFQKEIQMQCLIRKINETIDQKKKNLANREDAPKRKDNVLAATGRKDSWTGIFIVDESKLASCFAKLYGYYFVQRKCLLEGKHDESLFFAYLFLLVEMEGLGKEGFADNSRKPFFEFIQKRVVEGNMEKTMRTFHNRVDKLQGLRKQMLFQGEKLSEDVLWKNNSDYKNFHGIRGNFHRSRYFKELETLKRH